MSEFRMPSLGADMDAGTLTAWHVKPGDPVTRGAVIADVETDKGIVEVEIWEDGVVDSLSVSPGEKVPVGTVLAVLKSAAPSNVVPLGELRPLASPAARQAARELSVDLSRVRGMGPHGAITRLDVERAAASSATAPAARPAPAVQIGPPARARAVEPPAPAPAPEPVAQAPVAEPQSMRRAIAAAMARSKREIPHYYLTAEIDVQKALRHLEAENAKRAVTERVLFASVLLKATALALRDVPEMNGFFVDDSFRPSAHAHLGVAIATRQGGLVAPAMHDVQTKTVVEVQAALRDLVARTRAGRLRSSEMADATLTVTNLGDQGVSSVLGVIYPPQVAIVGFGRVVERPWAENGMIGVRPIVVTSLAADHRVSDGHRGAAFLSSIERLLQRPEDL